MNRIHLVVVCLSFISLLLDAAPSVDSKNEIEAKTVELKNKTGAKTVVTPLKSFGATKAPQEHKIIGYFDAKEQKELPVASLQHDNLTHVVLTNAIRVDSQGALHYMPRDVELGEFSAEELIAALTKKTVKLVVSIRGEPDDVALDELSENDTLREKFSTSLAKLLQTWGAAGAEIEWHSDDTLGGKGPLDPFDAPEQYHIALLCRDMKRAFRANANDGGSGKSLSVAVRPGRQEFVDSSFVRDYIDWLTVRAYSMRSLGDPHHASLKDMATALEEWTKLGVPNKQLVLGIPLFGRPGAALNVAGDRNEALRRSWKGLYGSGHATSTNGDSFTDEATGKTWWVSGEATTRAKAKHVVQHGYGGVAFRDLHQDGLHGSGLSLVRVAAEATASEGVSHRRAVFTKPLVLFQRGIKMSKGSGSMEEDELKSKIDL